jgi:hypothetical protein
MNKRTKALLVEAGFQLFDGKVAAGGFTSSDKMTENVEKLIELINKNWSPDPINKPFEMNPKFIAKCDEIGRSRRQQFN